MKTLTKFGSLCGAALIALTVAVSAFSADGHDSAMIERIKAVGEVCKASDNNCAAETAAGGAAEAEASAAAGRSGDEIVAKHCAMCHGTPGIPGAPRTAEEWAARLDAKGLDGLVASGLAGINAMPPKGMCMDCSDDEFKAAVEALSAQ